MSDRLSSRSIYHFTDSLENLLFIISNGFSPRCCIETRDGKESAIPMVSFCDIPLSGIDFHINKYGQYGLGLSKKWAIKHRITPVMYQANFKGMNENFDTIIETVNTLECNDKVNILKEKVNYFSWFIKNYEGKDFEDGTVIEFYNEREWRYIPDIQELMKNDLLPGLFNEDVKKIKEEFNEIWSEYYKLSFTFQDIKYIIVSKENEVGEVFNLFDKINLSQRDKIYQAIKVLTIENIVNDF